MTLKGTFENKSFMYQCFVFVFINTLGLFLWFNLSYLFDLNHPTISDLRISQILFSLFGLILPSFSAAYLFNKNSFHFLGLDKSTSTQYIALGILLFFVVQPFVNMINFWNENVVFPQFLSKLEQTLRMLQDQEEKLLLSFFENRSSFNLMINLFILALLPAISEELFFRGFLQKFIAKKFNPHFAIWITAILFSAYHLQFFGFFPRLILGALLGYLFFWSRSLYLPIIAHFVNNATLVLFYYFFSKEIITTDIDSIGIGNQWWISILSLILITPIITMFQKGQTKNKTLRS